MENGNLADRLKEILKNKCISQRELAARIGKDETMISRWLSGRTGISRASIDAIEQALGEKLDKSDVKSKVKVALITGITGQDGSFLAEFLLEKGYEVHGIMRRSSSFNTARIEHLYLDEWVRDMKRKRTINLHYGDMTDSSSLVRIIQQVQPDEIYNLAAQSHVKVSFDCPEYTAEADAVGTLRLLEAVRILGMEKRCRIILSHT